MTHDIADITTVHDTVSDPFPHLWPAVEVGLATCATLLLEDTANPVALILVGPPSAGKTTVATMFEGAMVMGESLCYRSDKFTPASFVSHSAKATRGQLAQIDLLPRIRHKVLLTPELSTIFRGKTDDLAAHFSIITRVLDGQGLTTDSGTHGQRGFTGDYLFAWIGCTTPISPGVWRVMGQLGSRLFFLVVNTEADDSLDALVQVNKRAPYRDSVTACQGVVHAFLDSLFTRYGGVRKVEWNQENTPINVIEGIAQCARLLSIMRTPDDRKEGVPAQPEAPYRANAVLYNLARGRALVHGRTQLDDDDLPMIAQVTLSSIPPDRRAALEAFAQNLGESLSAQDLENATGRSRNTVLDLMDELTWLGVTEFEKQGAGKPSHLRLHPEWARTVWGDFANLLRQGEGAGAI